MKNWIIVVIFVISAFIGWMSNDWHRFKFDKPIQADTVISWVTLPQDTQRVNFLSKAILLLENELTLANYQLGSKSRNIDSLISLLIDAKKDSNLTPVAVLDTILLPYKDTLNLKYYLVHNLFSFSYLPAYRKTQIKETTKYVDKLIEVNPKLWIQFAQQFNAEKFGGKVSLGYKSFGLGYGVLHKGKPLIELIYHQNF